jgi:hypothetical protein
VGDEGLALAQIAAICLSEQESAESGHESTPSRESSLQLSVRWLGHRLDFLAVCHTWWTNRICFVLDMTGRRRVLPSVSDDPMCQQTHTPW